MKLIFTLGVGLLFILLGPTSPAQTKPDELGKVATTWSGIDFQLFDIERIAGDRVLVGIKLVANADAPAVTSILVRIPKGADPSQTGTEPFSLSTAVATDEISKAIYPTVLPEPTGPQYLPGQMLGALRRNQGFTMSIQFEIPPAKPDANGAIPQVSVSLTLPNAKGPITHIVIPPPTPAAK